jgi:hypothetical protein
MFIGRLQRPSLRLALFVAALLFGAAFSGQADIFVNGVFTGTFVTLPPDNVPIDTLGTFSPAGTDLIGQQLELGFTYDATALASVGTGAYSGPNRASFTETASGRTADVGSSENFQLFLSDVGPPFRFALVTANCVGGCFFGGNQEVQTIILTGSSATISGVGAAQIFSGPAEVLDEFTAYTFESATGTYDSASELLIANGNVEVTATPEPTLLPALCMGFAGFGILGFRRRQQRSA